jgi:hypothetical protein
MKDIDGDIDTFLDDLRTEEQTQSKAKSNLIPITEFLKRRPRRKKFTIRDVAIAAYEKQRRR